MLSFPSALYPCYHNPPSPTQTCFLKETFVEEVELIKEELQSKELIVKGQYVSEDTMLNEWGWPENLRLNMGVELRANCFKQALDTASPRKRVAAVKAEALKDPKQLMRTVLDSSVLLVSNT